MAEQTAETTTQKPELTEEEKAERKRKREERKKKRAEKAAAFEEAHAASKTAHPNVWQRLEQLVKEVSAIPQEEQSGTAKLVSVVLRNRLRPGRKAKSAEKLQARKERLEKQMAKTLQQLGEKVPEHLQKYLDQA